MTKTINRLLMGYAVLTTAFLAASVSRVPASASLGSSGEGAGANIAVVGPGGASVAPTSDRARLAGSACACEDVSEVAVHISGDPAFDELVAQFGEEVALQITAEKNARESAAARVEVIKQYIRLDGATEQRLLDLYIDEERLNARTDLTPEADAALREKLPTEESIIGADNIESMRLQQEAAGRQAVIRANEPEVHYLTELLALTPEQEAKLLESYTDDTRTLKVLAATVARKLGLRSEQREAVTELMNRDFTAEVEEFLAANAGKLPADLQFDPGDGTLSPDYSKIIAKFRREEMRHLVDEEQFNRYLEYEAAQTW